MLDGKKGLILGLANKWSVAYGIAESFHNHKAELGFNYFPDSQGKMQKKISQIVEPFTPYLLEPCDVSSDQQIENLFHKIQENTNKIDFLVHSIAFAPTADIQANTIDCSREGFLKAMEISVYSFISAAKQAAKLMPEGGSMTTVSYIGGEKVIEGYNMMGVVKAALESAVTYLASDLGSQNIRVNCISAGALKTASSSAIGNFSQTLKATEKIAPLKRNISISDVGHACAFLASDFAYSITGEILHVDCGMNILGPSGKGRTY